MITIVFTSFNRPDYLEQVLHSWSQVEGVHDVPKHMFLEPGPIKNVMLEVVAESDLDIVVHENEVRNGVLHNPWVALDYAFKELNSSFTVLAEDDLIVSKDVLSYFEYASSAYSPDESLGVCSFRMQGNVENPGATFLENAFDVWVWGTWKQSWDQVLRNTWDHNYSTNNGIPGNQAGWDWNISRLTKAGKPFVRSSVSRSQHIGKDRGTHMVPWMFDQFQANTFLSDRETPTFYREEN